MKLFNSVDVFVSRDGANIWLEFSPATKVLADGELSILDVVCVGSEDCTNPLVNSLVQQIKANYSLLDTLIDNPLVVEQLAMLLHDRGYIITIENDLIVVRLQDQIISQGATIYNVIQDLLDTTEQNYPILKFFI